MKVVEITAEEFFRNKIQALNPVQQVITLSNEMISGEQGLRWAHEFKELHTSQLLSNLDEANREIDEVEEERDKIFLELEKATELLHESKLQIEYLNKKFTATGTSESVLSRLNTFLEGK